MSSNKRKKKRARVDRSDTGREEEGAGTEHFRFTASAADSAPGASVDFSAQLGKAAKTAPTKLKKQEREQLISETMRYILFADQRKEKVTAVKIRQKVLLQYQHVKGATQFVLSEAQKRFRHLFGFELVRGKKLDLTASTIRQAKSKEKSEDSYWIVNALARDYGQTRELLGACGSAEENKVRGVLLAIMGFLFCETEHRITESKLLHYLRQLNDIHHGDEDGVDGGAGGGGRGRKRRGGGGGAGAGAGAGTHIGAQGGILQYLQMFVTSGYLYRQRDPNATTDDGKAVFVYSAGQRFFTEVGWRSVVDFLAQANGETLDEKEVARQNIFRRTFFSFFNQCAH